MFFDLCNSASMITLVRGNRSATAAIPPRQFLTAIGGDLFFIACRK